MKKRAIIPGVNQSIIEIKIYPNMLFNINKTLFDPILFPHSALL
jgi:hypothetical protein